jgi:hypothetical protein
MKENDVKRRIEGLEIPSTGRESPVLVFLLGLFALGAVILFGFIGIILISH